MRADRLLSLLLLLQNQGRMTAGQLAGALEVSVRTVYRDIEALGAAGVPVQADRGPEGGYRLVAGYRTRLTGLTGGEAAALALAGAPGPAGDLGIGTELGSAHLKLSAALPPAVAAHIARARARFHLDATGWFRRSDPVPLLARVSAAVRDRRETEVVYRRWDGSEVRRVLRPLGLVLKGGVWYLVASGTTDEVTTDRDTAEQGDREQRTAERGAAERGTAERAATGPVSAGRGSAGRGSAGPAAAGRSGAGRSGAARVAGSPRNSADLPRSYRVSRFVEVSDSGAPFTAPEGFDLAAYWAESSERLEANQYRDVARVRLSPRAQRLLPMLFGTVAHQALEGAGPPDAHGWRETDLLVESERVAVGDLLRLGADAEVLGPPALRAALARTIRELACRYGEEPEEDTGHAAPG